jgi:hypothetical protein
MPGSEDRWAISDVPSTYCLAVDTRDFDLLETVLTEDVECIFQTGTRVGRDNAREFIAGVLSTLTATQHKRLRQPR